MSVFKNNLSIYRKIKKIKQLDIAEALGVTPSYISKIENGVQPPSKKFASAVAKYLKVNIQTLFPDKITKTMEKELKSKFKNRVWYYRKQKNLGQRDLSKKLGFSIAELSKIETGKKMPNKEMLEKLTKILGVSAKELFPK